MKRSLFCFCAIAALAACTKTPSERPLPPAASASPSASATATATAPAPAPAPAPASATAAAPAPASASASAPARAPSVTVLSIGMHVAGGPYDEDTKKPYLKAVEPRYPDLAKCWQHVAEPKQADVGVDLVIGPNGGHPKVSNPRSTIAGEGFIPCVVAFFESVEFDKPKSGGAQALSYSVRFKP